MFRVPDSLNMISSIFVYICEIKGVFFAMTNNSSVLLYLFRAQISSNLLGIIYEKKQEPTPRKCECIFLPHNIYSYQKEYYNNKHSTVKILCYYSSLSIIFSPY
jgi:hypothetical protein